MRKRVPGSSKTSILPVMALIALGGCSFAQRTRVEDSHKLTQTLQADNARLKDDVFSLRARSQDLTQRAIDDSSRIRELLNANQRLEKSVIAYQQEREKLADAFDRFKSEVASTSEPVPTALLDRFETFAKEHPGFRFDRETATLTMPTAALFKPGSGDLEPVVERLLREPAGFIGGPGGSGLSVLVVSRSVQSGVERTSGNAGDPSTTGNTDALTLTRACKVRDQLQKHSGLDESQFGVAGFETPAPGDDSSNGHTKEIQISLRKWTK